MKKSQMESLALKIIVIMKYLQKGMKYTFEMTE